LADCLADVRTNNPKRVPPYLRANPDGALVGLWYGHNTQPTKRGTMKVPCGSGTVSCGMNVIYYETYI